MGLQHCIGREGEETQQEKMLDAYGYCSESFLGGSLPTNEWASRPR